MEIFKKSREFLRLEDNDRHLSGDKAIPTSLILEKQICVYLKAQHFEPKPLESTSLHVLMKHLCASQHRNVECVWWKKCFACSIIYLKQTLVSERVRERGGQFVLNSHQSPLLYAISLRSYKISKSFTRAYKVPFFQRLIIFSTPTRRHSKVARRIMKLIDTRNSAEMLISISQCCANKTSIHADLCL